MITNLGNAPTLADVLVQDAQQSAVAQHIRYPSPNDSRINLNKYAQDVLRLAAGCPQVQNVDFAPPVVFIEDFIASAGAAATTTGGPFDVADNTKAWFVTEVDGGTGQTETVLGLPIDGAAGASAHGGWGEFVTCNADNDCLSAQLCGESFSMRTGKPLWFEVQCALLGGGATPAITGIEFWVGLAVSNTDGYGTAGAGATAGHVGFVVKADGQIVFSAIEAGSTIVQTDTTAEFIQATITTFETANVVHRLGFWWDGEDSIACFIDGVLNLAASISTLTAAQLVTAGKPAYANVSAALPVATAALGLGMSPQFTLLATGNYSAKAYFDYIMVAQAR